jgi:hypothetical protein
MGSGGIVPPSLTSVLDGGEWSTSRPSFFTPRERAPGTHCTVGWVGPTAGLSVISSAGDRTLIPRSSSRQPSRHTDCAIPAPQVYVQFYLDPKQGRGIAQAVDRRLPNAADRVRAQVTWDLWWTKWHWGRFPPSTSVSPANSHSIDCSTFIIYHPGLVQ